MWAKAAKRSQGDHFPVTTVSCLVTFRTLTVYCIMGLLFSMSLIMTYDMQTCCQLSILTIYRTVTTYITNLGK